MRDEEFRVMANESISLLCERCFLKHICQYRQFCNAISPPFSKQQKRKISAEHDCKYYNVSKVIKADSLHALPFYESLCAKYHPISSTRPYSTLTNHAETHNNSYPPSPIITKSPTAGHQQHDETQDEPPDWKTQRKVEKAYCIPFCLPFYP